MQLAAEQSGARNSEELKTTMKMLSSWFATMAQGELKRGMSIWFTWRARHDFWCSNAMPTMLLDVGMQHL
jgi:hypothetical protein